MNYLKDLLGLVGCVGAFIMFFLNPFVFLWVIVPHKKYLKEKPMDHSLHVHDASLGVIDYYFCMPIYIAMSIGVPGFVKKINQKYIENNKKYYKKKNYAYSEKYDSGFYYFNEKLNEKVTSPQFALCWFYSMMVIMTGLCILTAIPLYAYLWIIECLK